MGRERQHAMDSRHRPRSVASFEPKRQRFAQGLRRCKHGPLGDRAAAWVKRDDGTESAGSAPCHALDHAHGEIALTPQTALCIKSAFAQAWTY